MLEKIRKFTYYVYYVPIIAFVEKRDSSKYFYFDTIIFFINGIPTFLTFFNIDIIYCQFFYIEIHQVQNK